MIGGILVDIAVLAAVAAFAWAGVQLGGATSVLRTVAALGAIVAAFFLRGYAGDYVKDMIGAGAELSRLVGMLAVGVIGFIMLTKVLKKGHAKLVATPATGDDDEDDDDLWVDPPRDPLDDPRLAAVAGGVLGLVWAVGFVGVLVVAPSDSFYSRAATRSLTGTALIRQEGLLRWTVDGFPRYAQSLPKGDKGAIAGERDELPLRGDIEAKSVPEDADVLLRALNRVRRAERASTLVWNPEVAAVATRHALALAEERSLLANVPGGGSLDPQVQSALGASSGMFETKVGVLLSWSHGPANAGAAIIEDSDSIKQLRRRGWSEAGIGVADAGWFNGRIYVVLLIAPEGADDSSGADGAAGAAGAAGLAEAEPTGANDTALTDP